MATPVSTRYTIVLLPGDGIGPEVIAEARRVLDVVAEARGLQLQFDTKLIGGAAIDATGSAYPAETAAACKSAHAVLLGAVGGPKWASGAVRPEEGLLAIRKDLNLFANIRPVMILTPELAARSSCLKKEVLAGVDLVIVRELTGGIYFGERKEAAPAWSDDNSAWDKMEYSTAEIVRIARVAGRLAQQRRRRICSVDKANVLASSRLWRSVVSKVMAEEFPDVQVEHQYVDSMAMYLISRPSTFDVVLCGNLFGDILSDEASVLAGSLGLLASASLNGSGFGLYEPVHGSAPDIAGKGIANPSGTILSAAMLLRESLGRRAEATALERAVADTLRDGHLTADLAKAGEASLSCTAFADLVISNLRRRLERRPMTLAEKILCQHAIGLERPFVKPGMLLRLQVDWTLASELTWAGMEKTYSEIERPSVWRNDRFWLAVDHTVDPAINHEKRVKELIDLSQSFANEAKIVDYQPPNTTILHTDFYRQRAQPGMVIVGADSHSTSSGGLGTFSIGLGAADVVMPLVTGETWLKVPDTVRINYTGDLRFGIGGKDVILYTMGKLKRNTVAFERVVEYTGNLSALSCDSRFAITNMTAEFGGLAGVFEADEITAAYVAKRKRPQDKEQGLYFKADPDAIYVESHDINLSEIDSLVALYPSPDNVVPVDEVAGKELDGCFIGACTTAEEDLILAALVLRAGLAAGLKPVAKGTRKVTPGSVSIVARLRALGLVDVYVAAGFEVGAPGCSYCLGVAKDRAGEGEVWLSSQNRNFKNRMGKGSIANLASAATVAASSFSMQITNPRTLLDAIDRVSYKEMLDAWIVKGPEISYVEPRPVLRSELPASQVSAASGDEAPQFAQMLSGKVQRFEDHIDTDAIIPAPFMPGTDDTDLGSHCFEYFRPEFRQKVRDGFTIVVGGVGFGSGSSREEAPRAIRGCGVVAVIAKSFSFIYARNQPNMSLLGITLTDERFYELASEGAVVSIDVKARTVSAASETFKFGLSDFEERLLAGGGITKMFTKYQKDIFARAMGGCAPASSDCGTGADAELAW